MCGNVERILFQIFNGLYSRCIKGLCLSGALGWCGCGGALAGCFFKVGAVAAVFGVGHFALAGLGRHHEFMRVIAAHYTGVCLHGKSLHAAPLKNAHVGVVHFLVADKGGFVIGVKAIGIFHDEFARAHEAKARADFIAEFGLYLIKIER